MVVLCAGMFRSGSTWQYQVALDIARRSGRKAYANGNPTPVQVVQIIQEALNAPSIHVIKTHVPDPALIEYLSNPNCIVLFSYRDLRDVAYSMAHKISTSFASAVENWHVVDHCITIEDFWMKAPHKFVQRYETWMEDPRPFVARIAATMRLPISAPAILEISAEYSLDKQKERTAQIAKHFESKGADLSDPKNALLADPTSQLHWNHIREGRIGHWRELATPEQKIELDRLCGDWLVARGYETNHEWARVAPPG